MARVVILGAGLTGLSAAYHFEKNNFFDYKLFEKDETVGGLCRSVIQDGFTFDYTGHLLHVNDSYFKSFLETIAPLDQFNAITRRSYIYSQDTYTKYPYQINLHGLPLQTITTCIQEFVKRKKIKKITSFHDWVLHYFGKGIAQYFFFPYQEKIFCYDVKSLSTSWTQRFVPHTSLEALIKGALPSSSEETRVGYNAHFLYPKQGGIYYWVDKIAQQLRQKPSTGFCVQKVDFTKKIIYFENGAQEPFEHLITTLPLDVLLRMSKEASTTHLARAIPHLLCNTVINFNLGINREQLSEKHWIYYPEKKYPFYRIGFPHNFSAQAVPLGHSSLYGEFSFLYKSASYAQKKLKEARSITLGLLGIKEAEIVKEVIIQIPHAYVIYNHWRDKHVPQILQNLRAYNIYSIGRYGAWKYSSMQDAVLDGKHIVEELLLKV